MFHRHSKLLLVGAIVFTATHVKAHNTAERAILELMNQELIPVFLPEGSQAIKIEASAVSLKMDDIFTVVFQDTKNVRSLFYAAGLGQRFDDIQRASLEMPLAEQAAFRRLKMRKLLQTKTDQTGLAKGYNKIRSHVLTFYSTYATDEGGKFYCPQFAEALAQHKATKMHPKDALKLALEQLATKHHITKHLGKGLVSYIPVAQYVDDFSEGLLKNILRLF